MSDFLEFERGSQTPSRTAQGDEADEWQQQGLQKRFDRQSTPYRASI